MMEDDPKLVENAVEAVLFAATEPLSVAQIEARLEDGADVKKALASLEAHYEERGIELKKVGDKYAFRTSNAMAKYLRNEVTFERKLSRAAIETLAIIAYHQPTTRAEIEEIRGVAVSKGTLDQLLALEWIRLGKRRETPGRPVTFLTTTEFLDHFGLSSAKDLPGISELREAGLLERSPIEEAPSDEDVKLPEEELDELSIEIDDELTS